MCASVPPCDFAPSGLAAKQKTDSRTAESLEGETLRSLTAKGDDNGVGPINQCRSLRGLEPAENDQKLNPLDTLFEVPNRGHGLASIQSGQRLVERGKKELGRTGIDCAGRDKALQGILQVGYLYLGVIANLATNACVPIGNEVWNAPEVVGKLLEAVTPVTYALPQGSTAMPEAWS